MTGITYIRIGEHTYQEREFPKISIAINLEESTTLIAYMRIYIFLHEYKGARTTMTKETRVFVLVVGAGVFETSGC